MLGGGGLFINLNPILRKLDINVRRKACYPSRHQIRPKNGDRLYTDIFQINLNSKKYPTFKMIIYPESEFNEFQSRVLNLSKKTGFN